MTAMSTTGAASSASKPSPDNPTTWRDAVAGTGILVRLVLRRDRFKLVGWLLGITLLGFYYATELPRIYPEPEDLRAIGEFASGTVGALICGPGYGLAEPTLESALVAVYGLYFMLPAALMNILLISRSTRVEEQTGRAELIRANVVGRHAQLSAVLMVAVAANVVLALLIAGSFAVAGLETSDALLFGASVAAVGLVFAGVTTIMVQVTEYSRAASGLSGAVLGAAFVLRAAGDVAGDGGSGLSWVSPLAWSQQARPYADGRWWPLALSLGCAVVAVAVAYVLSARRDLGAGLVPPRPGSSHAAAWLDSPLALAFRLQRAGLAGWGCALAAGGALFGAVGDSIVASFEDLPAEIVDIMGGDPSQMLDGYVGTMAFFNALMVTIFVILAAHGLHAEETKGRIEPVLATATGRAAWAGRYTLVTALGAVVLLAVSGLAFGTALAISVGDGGYIWRVLFAHLAFTPALLLVLGVATVLYGLVPSALGWTWVIFVFALLVGFFGPIMDLPSWAYNLSPFAHIAQLPAEELRPAASIVLLALGGIGVVLGCYGIGRRDLDLK